MLRLVAPQDWPKEDRIQHYLVWLLKLSVMVAAVIAFATGSWETFFISLVALPLMFLPEIIESRVKINLPMEFDMVIVAFIYGSLFLGSALDVYEHLWWWDALLHTTSGFILSFAGFLLLYVKLLQERIQASSSLLVGLIIFCFGLAFGAIWEIFEYGIDFILNTNLQRSGLQDTMWDLIVDSIGALVMAIIGARFLKNSGKGFIARWIRRFLKMNPHLKETKNAGS